MPVIVLLGLRKLPNERGDNLDISKLNEEDIIKFIKDKISVFENSQEYRDMKDGINYYNGIQSIDDKKRMGINDKGKAIELRNLPNNRIKDNQYTKLVDQKVNYQFTAKPQVKHRDERYQEILNDFFDMKMVRLINKTASISLQCGVAWWYVWVDDDELQVKLMNSLEIIPDWSDNTHESLDNVIRLVVKSEWDEDKKKVVEKNYINLFSQDDVRIYLRDNDKLELIEKVPYIVKGDKGYSFGKIPFIYWKFNDTEVPLLNRVRSLQDGINTIMSNFVDNMLEDSRNTVLVLKGYGGIDDQEKGIRYQMNQLGYINIDPPELGEDQASIDTIEIKVNSENYKVILSILKEKLIENGRGIDSKNDRVGDSPNELNIKSMYSDIELDANKMELEFQASFEYLQYFFKKVNQINVPTSASISFKRNIMINESSVIEMIKNSVGIVSKETLINNHPLVDDSKLELDRLEEEQKNQIEGYFNHGL